VGTAVADQATVSGGSNPTGTVTFNLYNNSGCTGPALFTDTETLVGGTATSKDYFPTAFDSTTSTFYWVDTYHGDTNNDRVSSGCAAEPVTISIGPGLTLSPRTPDIGRSFMQGLGGA
jgi:hypothetical protein